ISSTKKVGQRNKNVTLTNFYVDSKY
ncbi:MAG: hypothetical protein Q611_LSC00321G0001, partial [Leuconostoc sp. DORA_2]